MSEQTEKDLEVFAKALLKVRNIEEGKRFLKDVFSSGELPVMATRLKIARMLYDGTPYVDIERHTGASSATIARVSESLKYGNDGLRTILERMKRKNSK